MPPPPRGRGRVAAPKRAAAKHAANHSDDDEGGNNGLMSSIVDLIGSAGDQVKPSIKSAAEELLENLGRLETDYVFLADRFGSSTSRRCSSAAAPSSYAADDFSDRSSPGRRDSVTSEDNEAGPCADDPAFVHLKKMTHDELVKYAIRLTVMVSAYAAKERQRQALNLLSSTGGSSDDEKDHHGRPGTTESNKNPLTMSMRSIVMPPVVHTDKISHATDFEGNDTINEYSVIADLGQGAYGKVKLAVNNTTNTTCAIKIMKKSVLKRGSGEMVVKREIAVMKKLRHRNVMPLYEVLDDPESGKVYLVMKYVDGGALVHVRGDLTCNPLPRDKAIRYFRQLISGLQYLHLHHVIHRDIKPDNILLDSTGVAYLTDFGVSDIVNDGRSSISGTEGTPVFLAPELLDSQTHVAGPPVDVWALGVTMYMAFFGQAPFRGDSWPTIVRSVCNDAVSFPRDTPAELVDIFTKVLEKDPAKRIALRHLKKHTLFDAINQQLAALYNVDDPADQSQAVMPESFADSPGAVGVDEPTAAEIGGSMRVLKKPINEDESAFDNMSSSIRGSFRRLADRIRQRVAERRLASLGGNLHSDDEDDSLRGTNSGLHQFQPAAAPPPAAVLQTAEGEPAPKRMNRPSKPADPRAKGRGSGTPQAVVASSTRRDAAHDNDDDEGQLFERRAPRHAVPPSPPTTAQANDKANPRAMVVSTLGPQSAATPMSGSRTQSTLAPGTRRHKSHEPERVAEAADAKKRRERKPSKELDEPRGAGKPVDGAKLPKPVMKTGTVSARSGPPTTPDHTPHLPAISTARAR